MKSNNFAALLIASLLSCDASWAATVHPAMPPGAVPYPIDHPGRADSPVDTRFLLDGPAGKHGFL